MRPGPIAQVEGTAIHKAMNQNWGKYCFLHQESVLGFSFMNLLKFLFFSVYIYTCSCFALIAQEKNGELTYIIHFHLICRESSNRASREEELQDDVTNPTIVALSMENFCFELDDKHRDDKAETGKAKEELSSSLLNPTETQLLKLKNQRSTKRGR